MEGKEHGIILLNKLQPPEIKTKTLRRTRLLRIIARNLDKKVTLLCAGAGYGNEIAKGKDMFELSKKIRVLWNSNIRFVCRNTKVIPFFYKIRG